MHALAHMNTLAACAAVLLCWLHALYVLWFTLVFARHIWVGKERWVTADGRCCVASALGVHVSAMQIGQGTSGGMRHVCRELHTNLHQLYGLGVV
jgi:hypothetical protein